MPREARLKEARRVLLMFFLHEALTWDQHHKIEAKLRELKPDGTLLRR